MKINIKNKLIEKGINKHKFSQLTNISYANICSMYEGKTDRIYFDTLERICIMLECTPNDILVSDNDQMNKLLSNSTSLNNTNNS